MALQLSNIHFKISQKKTFKFKQDRYTMQDIGYDILIFKDFFGKAVPKNLYILPPGNSLSGANNEANAASQRVLSTGDGGNKFDFKLRRAVKAYQLLNRGKILQYRNQVLNEDLGTTPSTDMNLQQVLRIFTNNEVEGGDLPIEGQQSGFGQNFGRIDEATLAIMLGWHPDFTDILEKNATGYGVIGNNSPFESPYFARLSRNDQAKVRLFDKYYKVTLLSQEQKRTQKSYLNSIGINIDKKIAIKVPEGNTGQVSLKYTTTTNREVTISISHATWEGVYNSGNKKASENFTRRPSVLPNFHNSIVQVERQRQELAAQLDENAKAEGAETTVTQTSDQSLQDAANLMAKPNPENQSDEPFEENGNIHVFVETDYLLKDEALLYSRLGVVYPAGNSPPVLTRKTTGSNAFVKEVQEVLFVTGVLTAAEKRVKTNSKRFKKAAKVAKFQAKRGWHKNLSKDKITLFQRAYHVDGSYGPGTVKRVVQYQKDKKLKPRDGKVGEKTYRALMADYPGKLPQVEKSFNPPGPDVRQSCDFGYITRTLAKKALLSVCRYFKKTTKFQLDFNDVEIKKLFSVQSDRFVGNMTPLNFDISGDEFSDDSYFSFESVDIINVYPSGEEHLVRAHPIAVPPKVSSIGQELTNAVDDDLSDGPEPLISGASIPSGGFPINQFVEGLKDKYVISPSRPGQYFKVEYVINKEKFNKLVMSAGTEKIVDAVDAALIAIDTAADIYNKVSKFLEDPHAAFDLVEEKVEKAIEDAAAATKEVISDYKRAVTKDLAKNSRNTWSKLRKRTERDKRNKRLKDKKQLQESIEKVHQRKVELLGGQVDFDTRTFKRTLDKVAKKMSTMGDSYEDFKEESKKVQENNKKVMESGKGDIAEDPFAAYADFFGIKPDVNLVLESKRLKEVYGALRTFLKKNGFDFEDSFGKKLAIKFEKVEDNYGVVLGSRISRIDFKTPEEAKSKENSSGVISFADEERVTSGIEGELKSNLKTFNLVRGFDQLLRKEPFNNPRIMSYLAQLLEIEKTHIRRPVGSSCDEIERIPALDFISMYSYPSPSVSSLQRSANTKPKTENNEILFTATSNLEEEAGAMLQHLKTTAKQFSERMSVLSDPEQAKKMVEFQEGKTYKATDLLPLGELCTYDEIKEKFLDTFDFKSYWCEFSECLPDIPWPINFNFNFDLPRLPSLPTIPDLTIILNKLLINLIEMLVRFLCTLVNKLLDLIRLPNCDEVFEAALYGAASLVDGIRAYDKMREPIPASYDISSQFLQYDGQERQRQSIQEDFKVKKKMLDSLTSYGIPENLINDPENEVNASTMTDMMDDISALLRPSEITGLLRGQPTNESLGVVRSYISTKLPSLEDYLGSESSISDFFKNLGGLIDIDVLRKIEEIPSVLVQNRLCPEAIDVRHRVIMGDLSTEQLELAISAHKEKTRQDTQSMLSMLENNPIQNEFQDLYNPGDPNAVFSKVPGPMMDVIESSTKSIFEVPKFSIITDVGGYTNLLHENVNNKLQYEDAEFSIQAENRALEAIERLIKNEDEIQSALTSTDLQRKWRLREALYERFVYDVITVKKELETIEFLDDLFGTQNNVPVSMASGYPGAENISTYSDTGATAVKTTVTVHEDVSQAQIANGLIADTCGDGVSLKKTETTEVYPIVKRKGVYNMFLYNQDSSIFQDFGTYLNPLILYNQEFTLSNILPFFEESGESLVPLELEEGQVRAPVLSKSDGSKILEAEDLANLTAEESAQMAKEITDSIVRRLSQLNENILVHIEINMADKNESALLPEVRNYYIRSNEFSRETSGDGFFEFKKNMSENELVFDLALPERFNSYIRYEEIASTGVNDEFSVTIEDQVLMGSSESFYGCDTLPAEYVRPTGIISLGKKEIYVNSVHDAIKKSLDFYRTNEILQIDSMIEGFTKGMTRSGNNSEVGEVGKVFYKQVYNKTFESLFETVVDQLAAGKIFTDSEYVESLNSRLRGIKEYDANGCLIRESKGVIDFDQVVRDATARVTTAFENPAFHPSKAEFNEDSIGPFELGIIHSCIYLMVNLMLIEFALRGGIAFSFFDAEELFGVNEENKTSELFRNYIVKFIYKSLGSLSTFTKDESFNIQGQEVTLGSGIVQFFREPFLDYCIEYVKNIEPKKIVEGSTKEQQQMSAIEYVVDDIIKDGGLVSMINSVFKGDSLLEPRSFAESYLMGSQILPVPEESLSYSDESGQIKSSWLQTNVQDVPDLSKKGRFFLQKYIRVSGPAAAKDLSQYTFTDEFLEFRDGILRELSSISQDDIDVPLVEDPAEIAEQIRERIDILTELEPLPGAEDDSYTSPSGFQTELVSIKELQDYLNDSYQNSFNEELCELLGLIYREDPQDVCFLMPIQFERYPGKYIKKTVKHMRIDRGFSVGNAAKIKNFSVTAGGERFQKWKQAQDQQELVAATGIPVLTRVVNKNIGFEMVGADYFNDVFDISLFKGNEHQQESTMFKEGIFSKCGRLGNLGNLTLVQEMPAKYYVLPQDICEMSSDYGSQESINAAFLAYSEGSPDSQKEKLLLDLNLTEFAKSFTPDVPNTVSDGAISIDLNNPFTKKVNVETSNVISAMDGSYEEYQNFGSIESQTFQSYLDDLEQDEERTNGVGLKDFEFFTENGITEVENLDNGVFPWKMGEVTLEEFEQQKSLETVTSLGLNPDLQNSEKYLGPNNVYEEWTQYLIEDPGYVFDKPGESLHCPESMGSMTDPNNADIRYLDEGLLDTGVATLGFNTNADAEAHWINHAYHQCIFNIEDAIGPQPTLGNQEISPSTIWGWGATAEHRSNGPFGDIGAAADNRKGWSTYRTIFRFQNARNSSRQDVRYPDIYPKNSPIMSRPLGYQSESLEHENTNELKANEYVMPVYLLVTRVDYKIGDTILHTDTYIGSKFNDRLGIFRGADLNKEHKNGLISSKRRKLLSESISRLTMEWIQNTTQSLILTQQLDISGGGAVGSNQIIRDLLMGKVLAFRDSFSEGGFGSGLTPAEVLPIVFAMAKGGGILTDIITGNQPDFFRLALSTANTVAKFERNVFQPYADFITPRMTMAADAMKNGYTTTDILGRPDITYTAESVIESVFQFNGDRQATGDLLYKTLLPVLVSSEEDYGLRPLSRGYDIKKGTLAESFNQTRYKTNMCTTSKIYSAAALLAGNLDFVTPIYPPKITGVFGGDMSNPNRSLPVESQLRSSLIDELMTRSIAVNPGASGWESASEIFDFSNNDPERETQNLLQICNQYTEKYLNTRTYEGFWGFTSSPQHLRGFSFVQLLKTQDDMGHGLPYGSQGEFVPGDSPPSEVSDWSKQMRIYQTFPPICGQIGDTPDSHSDVLNLSDHYSLQRLPYPATFQGTFAGNALPEFATPEHLMVGDGRSGANLEQDIETFKSNRGDLDIFPIERSINEERQVEGFKSYLVNKSVQLLYKSDYDERYYWARAGDELATPRDEVDTMSNYSTLVRDSGIEPRGIFERLNFELREQLKARLDNLIRGSKYSVGLRLVQVLSDLDTESIDQVIDSDEDDNSIRRAFDLLMAEERLTKTTIQNSNALYNYVIPIVDIEMELDNCTLNWKRVSASAEAAMPEMIKSLSQEPKYLQFIESAFPLQRFSLLSGLYSVMALSTKDGFQDFMTSSKYSIVNIFDSITKRDDFERIPSGAELWMKMNGYMTSVGPQPPLSEVAGEKLDGFIQALIENAYMTPTIMLRNLSGVLDPAYKAMMAQKGVGSGQIDALKYSSIGTSGLKSGRMENGLTCDGNYVPINVGFPRDIAANLFPIPNKDFFRALKKFVKTIRRYKQGGTSDSYGDFLGPFGALALSLPELPGDVLAREQATKREQVGQPVRCPPVQQTPLEEQDNGDNSEEQDN